MDDGDFPPQKTIFRELCTLLRQVEGHTNCAGTDKYWLETGGLQWPTRTVWEITEKQRWPKGKTLKGSATRGRRGAAAPAAPASATEPGRPPVRVSGLKYGMRGCYSSKVLGPGIQPSLARALVEAANFSLTTSTWRAYSSVWKQVGKLGRESGITYSLPMNRDMVRGIVGALIKKGRKSSTVLSYMSSLKKIHEVEGVRSEALEDSVVKAALRGLKNRESLTPVPRPVMSLEKLAKAKVNLRKKKMAGHKKQVVWAAMTFMFFGSLRGSELLAPRKDQYDPVKTLFRKDVKLVELNTGKEVVSTVQLTLKAPKTSKSNPNQVVELPELGEWYCPVRAYKSWQCSRKGRQLGSQPLFTWRDNSLVTMEEMNTILATIATEEDPPITTRAFRPALPSILARQGATEETLKSLGQWTSRTYLHYVHEGQSADWRGLLLQLRNLRI